MAEQAEWWFYHVEHTSLDAAIAPLLEKCLERRWRVVIAGRDDTLSRLDASLWTMREDNFLPHGKSDAENQPILLAAEAEPANGAQVALLLDGTDADASRFERCMVVFSGTDQEARAKARAQFKTASDAGATARYFQQEGRTGWKEWKAEKK